MKNKVSIFFFCIKEIQFDMIKNERFLVWENLIDAYKMFLEIFYEKRNKQIIFMLVFIFLVKVVSKLF